MTRNGRGLNVTKQEWIKYAALFLLAVAAFGVSWLALTNPRGASEAVSPVTVTPPSATPTATVTPTANATPSPKPKPKATAERLGIELPAEPVVLILGDSYTAGMGADPADQGWAYLVAGSLGYPTNIDGVPGTGFAWGGGEQDELAQEYEVRLQAAAQDPSFVPNILILQGGQNDAAITDPAEVKIATAETIEAARRFWPGIQVVVMGPSAPLPFAGDLSAANSAVRAGAAAAKAPFIDAVKAGWFTGANSPEFNFDGAHPNTAGHAHIAEKFLKAWATLTD
ncbi:SGNH/GDSL hydrolase family protein [Pseudarthrobacter sulfonivorans]|uniref:SGNH/GDSL hydrolase family protein n=1 Tax=Pseudarthrobacter sulfonivorans TaxID=121292 RepID=UPI0028578645|nr:SGNH/GDSL hydrolase family protein [Pseudarthrobacter sulfonivorans]MDR6413327.1 lysophospholipase L1-like esterase [Pseudarthrobacter sulfonivorans]